MKVAIITAENIALPERLQHYSAEIVTYELAKRLAKFCEVIVYAKRSRYQSESEFYGGVNYRRFSPQIVDRMYTFTSTTIDKMLPGFSHTHPRRPFSASSLYDLSYALQVLRDLRRQKCDIVHIHNSFQFIPLFQRFNPQSKTVLHMHNEWLTQLDKSLTDNTMRLASLIISVSDYIRQKIQSEFPQFAENCVTMYDGVDTNRFVNKRDYHPTEEDEVKRILFVGRNSPEKGLHILLEAFKKVVDRYPKIQLEIVGPQERESSMSMPQYTFLVNGDPKVQSLKQLYNGNYIADLQNNIHASLTGKVSFRGLVSRDQLIKHYQNADVFVFPSIWDEPFGMPIIEAMATETPVVATRVGGIPEIVKDNETGILVEPADANTLADAILRLLSDDSLRESMGKAARKRAVELFAWEHIVEKLVTLYRSTAG